MVCDQSLVGGRLMLGSVCRAGWAVGHGECVVGDDPKRYPVDYA